MGISVENKMPQAVPELREGNNVQPGDQIDAIVGGYRFVSLGNVVAITTRSDTNKLLVAEGPGPFRLDILVGEDRHRLSIAFPKDAAPALLMGKLADAARKQGLNCRISTTEKELAFGNEPCVVFDPSPIR